MKELPKDPVTLESRTRLLVDKWRVTERVSINKKNSDRNRVIVEIWYDGACVFDSNGGIALANALDSVKRWVATGYVPKIPPKVLADYENPATRGKIARKQSSGVAARS